MQCLFVVLFIQINPTPCQGDYYVAFIVRYKGGRIKKMIKPLAKYRYVGKRRYGDSNVKN